MDSVLDPEINKIVFTARILNIVTPYVIGNGLLEMN
jgi:hypothetical protein